MQSAKYLLVVLVLLITAVVSASDYGTQASDQDLSLLARLSYQNSSLHRQGGAVQNTHICISIYVDGHYRVLLTNEAGNTPLQEGKLTPDQYNKLQFLLNTDAFRHLEGSHGALIRGNSESFVAEVPRAKNVQRISLTIADETRHFPKPVERVVEWLTDFTPVNAKTIERTEFPGVCPTPNGSGYQPLAENFGPSNGSCVSADKKFNK